MITKIEIENINSIGKASIDFTKGKYQFREHMIFENSIVSPVAFYGKNGSGKSSFFDAVRCFVNFLIREPDKIDGFIPNLVNLKEKKPNAKSVFKIRFKLDDDDFEYFLGASINEIYEEYLNINEDAVFSRLNNAVLYQNDTINLESSVYPFLRKAASNIDEKNDIIAKAFNFLSNIAWVDANVKKFCVKKFIENPYSKFLVEKTDEIQAILEKYGDFPLYKTFLKQKSESGDNNLFVKLKISDNKFLSMPYEFASNGMKSQDALLTAVLSLPEQGVLFVDELECGLHPLTIMNFINVAREKKIQLIFSTHNTSILSKLRPDQIVFAHWNEGFSTYQRLSDIYPNIREVNNIEKMYLSSYFDEGIEK